MSISNCIMRLQTRTSSVGRSTSAHGGISLTYLLDELRNLHIGQGSDLYWSHSKRCPTVDEYLEMIRQSKSVSRVDYHLCL